MGSYGSGDGRFRYPWGIAVDSIGNAYVADTENGRVQVFSGDGTFLEKWGSWGSGDGQFDLPRGIALDANGNVYVTDYSRVQVFSSTGAFLRRWGSYGSGDGQFGYPVGIALDSNGKVYVADLQNYRNYRVQVFSGLITDSEPPVTTAAVSGTLGNNGWYVSDVLVTLTATDNNGGSGVKEIRYNIDGTETIIAGSSASFTLNTDGTHGITYYAKDNAGNSETSQPLTVNIDKTPPAITAVTAGPSTLWPPNHKMVDVVINGLATDNGSGVASVDITVTDEYGIYNMTVPGFGSTIQLEAWREGTDRDGRQYIITATVTDKAGNQSTETSTVLVPHDMR
jgi:NHL repeat